MAPPSAGPRSTPAPPSCASSTALPSRSSPRCRSRCSPRSSGRRSGSPRSWPPSVARAGLRRVRRCAARKGASAPTPLASSWAGPGAGPSVTGSSTRSIRVSCRMPAGRVGAGPARARALHSAGLRDGAVPARRREQRRHHREAQARLRRLGLRLHGGLRADGASVVHRRRGATCSASGRRRFVPRATAGPHRSPRADRRSKGAMPHRVRSRRHAACGGCAQFAGAWPR